jgi:hypothetical protein
MKRTKLLGVEPTPLIPEDQRNLWRIFRGTLRWLSFCSDLLI